HTRTPPPTSALPPYTTLFRSVDGFEVGLGQDAAHRLQAQPVEQRAIAGLGQVALRGIQLLLRIEHVQVDAHADLVACLVGLYGRAAGVFAGFQGRDARQARHDARVVLPGLLDGLTARGFVVFARFLLKLDFFGDLGRYAAARVNGHGQHQPDGTVDGAAARGFAVLAFGAAAGGAQAQGRVV